MALAASRSRTARAAAWVLDAVISAGSWVIVWGILAVLAFWQVPGDTRDRDIAEQVQNRGGTMTVFAVEVHVDYEHAKGGGWHEVDQVRVRLSEMDQWRDLDAVANEDTLSEDRDWDEGWQGATKDTGYALPLRVAVTHNGRGEVEHIVAERDIAYWTQDNIDPEIGLALGAAATAIGLGGAAGWAFWSGRSTARAGRTYPGATRAERRAARERDAQWARANRKRKRHR